MTIKAILETILFVYGEPITTEKLGRISKTDKADILKALEELSEEYNERGFTLLQKNGHWQLGSNPKNTHYIEELVKSEFGEELSRAAVETVAIIAYKGLISRADIEFIRGVNSSFTIRNLMMRGLIERIENPRDARAYQYRISFDFLAHLGITNIEELPHYEAYQKELSRFEEHQNKDPMEHT